VSDFSMTLHAKKKKAPEVSQKWMKKPTPNDWRDTSSHLSVIRKDDKGRPTYSYEKQSLHKENVLGQVLRHMKQMNIPIDEETISYLLPILHTETNNKGNFQIQQETGDPILYNTPVGRQLQASMDESFPVGYYLAPLIIQQKLQEYGDVMFYNGQGQGTSTYKPDKGAKYDALLWKKNVERLRKMMQTDPQGRDAYSAMMTGMQGKQLWQDPRFTARQIGRVSNGLEPQGYNESLPWRDDDPFETLIQQWVGR